MQKCPASQREQNDAEQRGIPAATVVAAVLLLLAGGFVLLSILWADEDLAGIPGAFMIFVGPVVAFSACGIGCLCGSRVARYASAVLGVFMVIVMLKSGIDPLSLLATCVFGTVVVCLYMPSSNEFFSHPQ